MAIIIGFCLAAPLEVRIMKTEVEAALTALQMDRRNELNAKEEASFREDIAVQEKKKAEAEAKLRKIDDDIRNRENNITQQRKKIDDEASGKSPTGTPGRGPAYETKMRNLDAMTAELGKYAASVQDERAQLKAEAKQAADAMEARRKKREETDQLNASKAANYDGLIKRIQIAHDVGGWASILLKFFLIVIEVAPIFFKMMMPRGPYLSLVENQAEIVLAREAITKDLSVTPGSTSTVAHVQERFHRADTIRAFEVSQLESERELTRIALEANVQLKAQDIRANPKKYLDDGSRPAPTA
jgi:Skp family chaperone for outer membrane proteins